MSIPSPKQAYAFLTPLKNKSSAFIVQDRRANLFVARFALSCLATLRMRTLILDTNCFYGTNVEILANGLPEKYLRDTKIITISNHLLERSLAELTTKETRVLIIDDMNALRSLLSRESRNSSIHKLFLLIRVLSYEARVNNLLILTTVYKNANTQSNLKRSLSSSADLQITTEVHSPSLTFNCDSIENWPGNKFAANVYFALKT